MIGFQLGREYKLSVAEILTVFPEWKTVYLDMAFLILEWLKKEDVIKKADMLGGTIKIIEILNSSILKESENNEWKFKYWLSIFWEKWNLKKKLILIKKELKWAWISSRFVNKDFKNLSSAQIIWEKLVNSGTDFTEISNNWINYFGKTLWIQNIYAYSKRDYSKERDMQTGMLPPKLCQIMINISKWQTIYDPFVWLGTVLIESINMWNIKVYWSDLNEVMVETTWKNIIDFSTNRWYKLEDSKVIKLNAKFINESEILLEKDIDSIITEWYLWEMMTKKNISTDRINKQKDSLISIYEKFFANLEKINYKWNLVICFPFWELKWIYIYFNGIYSIISKYCNIEPMFPSNCELETTKSWSLLYKRDKQLVWREIFKLKMK